LLGQIDRPKWDQIVSSLASSRSSEIPFQAYFGIAIYALSLGESRMLHLHT
jgi:hypothetical protein